jgi:nitrilase
MKIAAVQMVSTPDRDRNLADAVRLIAQAAQCGARLVALPEYFCLMGRRDTDKLLIAEADGDGPIQAALSAAARDSGVWLIGGTLPLRSTQPDRVFNSSLVYGPDGARIARYDKLHLFQFETPSERYDEGRVLLAGGQAVAVGLTTEPGWQPRVGLSVCYDLRFPELYRQLMQTPCDLLAVPSAFTYTTGLAHWSLLLRARAVENQTYVIAPAQGGRHENGRRTYGHSMIVDPWGEVLAQQEEGEGVVLAEMDREALLRVREQLPALRHRRNPLAAHQP